MRSRPSASPARRTPVPSTKTRQTEFARTSGAIAAAPPPNPRSNNVPGSISRTSRSRATRCAPSWSARMPRPPPRQARRHPRAQPPARPPERAPSPWLRPAIGRLRYRRRLGPPAPSQVRLRCAPRPRHLRPRLPRCRRLPLPPPRSWHRAASSRCPIRVRASLPRRPLQFRPRRRHLRQSQAVRPAEPS